MHLDHGGSYELAERCVEAGYTSVMFDGSKLPFAENCKLTRRVELARAHGVSVEGEVRLDFERLDRIRDAVGERVALVLHGGSGVPEELLRRAVAHGINKINFGTELKDAFTRAVKTTLADTDDIDLRKTFAPAIYAVQQMAAAKIKICRAGG